MPPRPLGLNAGVAPCGVWGGLFTSGGDPYLATKGRSPSVPSGLYPDTKKAASLPLSSTLSVLLYVVETQRKDFKDNVIQDFYPVFFFAFSFHFRS